MERKEAKQLGLEHYFTGRACKNDHICDRRTSDGHCLECDNKLSSSYRTRNVTRVKQSRKKYYNNNCDMIAVKQSEWVSANRDHVNKRQRLRRNNNPSLSRKHSKNYYQKHKDKDHIKSLYANVAAQRRASKLQATPAWADKQAIRNFYDESRKLTKLTGIQHHVDHIVPLRGENVCGLHVEYNLQILTKADNLSKGNKFQG